jgi:hypothetical protein
LGQWLERAEFDVRGSTPAFDIPENTILKQIREANRKTQEALETLKPPTIE